MNRKMMKVFIGLIVMCTLIGTVAGLEVASGYPTASSPSMGSIVPDSSVPTGSSGNGVRGVAHIGWLNSEPMSTTPSFYPGGHECYYGGQCGTCPTCTQPAPVCTPVCTQQCTPQPPCCKDVCTEQCTCTPVCQQVCTEQPPICTPVCTQQCTQTTSSGYGGCMYGGCQNWGVGGSYCSDCCDYCNRYQSYNRFSFFANETEIEDVSGEWETDLFGPLYMKLTGDDILRAMYEVDGNKGYMQGDFDGNTTPNVVGFWWQEPTFELFNNAGGFSMTFDFEETTMEGIYAYGDGTWAPFTGSKVSLSLSEEVDEALYDMPEYSGEISEEEMPKLIDAPNPIETNPLNA